MKRFWWLSLFLSQLLVMSWLSSYGKLPSELFIVLNGDTTMCAPVSEEMVYGKVPVYTSWLEKEGAVLNGYEEVDQFSYKIIYQKSSRQPETHSIWCRVGTGEVISHSVSSRIPSTLIATGGDMIILSYLKLINAFTSIFKENGWSFKTNLTSIPELDFNGNEVIYLRGYTPGGNLIHEITIDETFLVTMKSINTGAYNRYLKTATH